MFNRSPENGEKEKKLPVVCTQIDLTESVFRHPDPLDLLIYHDGFKLDHYPLLKYNISAGQAVKPTACICIFNVRKAGPDWIWWNYSLAN